MHNTFSGCDIRGSPGDEIVGAEIFQISATRVYVAVGPDDETVAQIRVRIWARRVCTSRSCTAAGAWHGR